MNEIRLVYDNDDDDDDDDDDVLHDDVLWASQFALSTNIVTIIASRRMRWEGHVACMVQLINTYTIFV
jgi:hypothetical protein